jgi:hypothetical protein
VEIRNETPHAAGWTVFFDKRAGERLLVAVKGTWSLSERAEPALAEEPAPLLAVDECYGEPGKSSIRYEADLAPLKRATDVALVGSARARNRDTRRMTVSLRVGTLERKLRVTGERSWLFGVAGIWFASRPGPFSKVPLVWELARGGTDDTPASEKRHSLDLRNPVGRGFRARRSRLAKRGSLLPQIAGAGFRERRRPAGVGFVAGHWEPRRRFVGTYDDAWLEQRSPLLPLDFDERFFNAAAPGLVAGGYLRGGESVEVVGCTPSGRLAFRLPREQLRVAATFARREVEPIDMRLCTVTIDTDTMQLFLTWRGELAVHRRFPRLEHITVARGEAAT